MELEITRESAKQATIYSTISIVLAFIAIVISLYLNPKQPYEVKIVDYSGKEKIAIPAISQTEQVIISDSDSIKKDSINQ